MQEIELMTKENRHDDGEQRRYLRIPFESVLHCKPCSSKKATNSEFAEAASVLSKNISQSGILINSSKKVDVGHQLSLELTVPSMEGYSTIDITGRVCWVRQLNANSFDCGVEFTEVKPEDADILRDFIAFFPTEDEELGQENVSIITPHR